MCQLWIDDDEYRLSYAIEHVRAKSRYRDTEREPKQSMRLTLGGGSHRVPSSEDL